jgi:hypothetical protein
MPIAFYFEAAIDGLFSEAITFFLEPLACSHVSTLKVPSVCDLETFPKISSNLEQKYTKFTGSLNKNR